MCNQILKKLIKPGQVFVFSGAYCPFCIIAKRTLSKYKIEYKERDLSEEPLDSHTRKQLNNLSGINTIPKIFIGEICIGGNSALQEMISTGELFDLLDEENISYKH